MDDAVAETDAHWAESLREIAGQIDEEVADSAFSSSFSMFASDQGVRPLMGLFNDLSFVVANKIGLRRWHVRDVVDDLDPEAVSRVMADMRPREALPFLIELTRCLATYDWRSSKAPGLSDPERVAKLAFRGSSGYRELRKQLLDHVYECADSEVLIEAVEHVQNRT